MPREAKAPGFPGRRWLKRLALPRIVVSFSTSNGWDSERSRSSLDP